MTKTKAMLWGAFLALLLSVDFAEAQSTRTATFTVNWNDPNSGAAQEDGVELFYAPAQTGPFTSLTVTKPDVIQYVHTVPNDPGNTTLCFRVQAFNKVGKSAMSNIICGTSPTVTVPPGAVTVSVTVTVTVVP